MSSENKYFGLKSYRLLSMPYAQCHLRIYADKNGVTDEICLYSYKTLVCVIRYEPTRDCYVLYCTGTYSSTTRRHINRFTTEFCGVNMYPKCRDSIGTKHYTVDFGYYVDELPTRSVMSAVENYYYNGKSYYGFGDY